MPLVVGDEQTQLTDPPLTVAVNATSLLSAPVGKPALDMVIVITFKATVTLATALPLIEAAVAKPATPFVAGKALFD